MPNASCGLTFNLDDLGHSFLLMFDLLSATTCHNLILLVVFLVKVCIYKVKIHRTQGFLSVVSRSLSLSMSIVKCSLFLFQTFLYIYKTYLESDL